MPFAGHMVDFDPNAVRVLEEHGVVAGRKLVAVLGRVNDVGAKGNRVGVNGIHVFLGAGSQAEVVQSGRPLIECVWDANRY